LHPLANDSALGVYSDGVEEMVTQLLQEGYSGFDCCVAEP
jgi:hypothetical protein